MRGGVLKEESAETMLSDIHLAKLKMPLHKDERTLEVIEGHHKRGKGLPRDAQEAVEP